MCCSPSAGLAAPGSRIDRSIARKGAVAIDPGYTPFRGCRPAARPGIVCCHRYRPVRKHPACRIRIAPTVHPSPAIPGLNRWVNRKCRRTSWRSMLLLTTGGASTWRIIIGRHNGHRACDDWPIPPTLRLCSPASSLLRTGPISRSPIRSATALGLPPQRPSMDHDRDLPDSARNTSIHASGL